MHRFLITLILAVTLVLATTPVVFASGKQYGGYGGYNAPQGGVLVLNKTVQNPQTGQFVDNLSVNDPKFAPDSAVTFQLTVTNTGGTTLATVTVKDTFPQFVSFQSGAGNFDANSKTLTFTVSDLKPSESKTYTLVGRTAAAGNLPANDGVTCVTNQSMAQSGDQTSSDTAQLCIQKQGGFVTKGGLQVFPAPQATKTPGTGPEALPMIGSAIAGLAGFIIRKKSRLS